MRIGFFSFFVSLVFTIVCASAQTTVQHADRIFLNGKIWTEDDARPLAQALAISGDKILSVGSNNEVKALAGPDTLVIDLRGRLMVPGFQDSHLHVPGRSVNNAKQMKEAGRGK